MRIIPAMPVDNFWIWEGYLSISNGIVENIIPLNSKDQNFLNGVTFDLSLLGARYLMIHHDKLIGLQRNLNVVLLLQDMYPTFGYLFFSDFEESDIESDSVWCLCTDKNQSQVDFYCNLLYVQLKIKK